MPTREQRIKDGELTAEQLKAKRERLKMTQEDFADHLRTTVKSVRNWEGGHRRIPPWVSRTLNLLSRIHNLEGKDGKPI